MKRSISTILIVDDEPRIRKVLKISLQQNYSVLLAKDGTEARQYLQHETIDLILSDLKMPGGIGGLELLSIVQKEFKQIPIVIMTAFGTIENAVEAMKLGAFDYIIKPIKITELTPVIEKALRFSSVVQENRVLKEQLKKYTGHREIITANPAMRKLLAKIQDVAQTPATVLIQGKSGTGKQLVAGSVHYLSPRADHPFVEINCGAIPHELMESELFGHEKGAFTGAVKQKKGKFELADGGTLFLDEIGELPLDLQVKLLHILENQRFTRVGGTNFIKTDARIVAATNRDLAEEVAAGRFRQDLFYRLKVVFVKIPSLQERREDVPLLADFFLKKHKKLNIQSTRKLALADEALNALVAYTWPGNVRELENVIQQAVIFAKDGRVELSNLPEEIKSALVSRAETKAEVQKEKQRRTDSILRQIEYDFLKRLLTSTRGNISHAAEKSGYDRRQIQNLIKKHRINIENFKN